MTQRLLLTAFALVALAGALSFGTVSHAQEAAGGCTPATTEEGGFGVIYNMPPAIPDNDTGGISLCMNVTSTQSIYDLRVMVGIAHTWVGDLVVTLRHEQTGTTVTLVDRPGLPAMVNGCGGDDLAVLFDDGAPTAAEDECAVSPPALFGTFRPSSPLSAFDGETIGGRWWLEVSDVAAQDTGIVHQWGIISFVRGDADCNGHTNAIDAALVLQYDAGLTGLPVCPAYADFNSDMVINSIDAALILQFAAGLLPV